ncbi:hypothetical protein D0Z00_000636 [Geotrichum galactomycetum]|uniref:Uncharacterized protein n=1 Tax=Geotrichum galactomycetum TaxID=27317 RepID=A0ACB6V932_9ASCO|nr:hypothetical protein D0Z00_000636 [Geotrichum candidum]
MYPTPVEIPPTKKHFATPINVDHLKFIKNLEDPELVPREHHNSVEAGDNNKLEEAPERQAETKTRRQKKLNKKKAAAKEAAEQNDPKSIVFKGLYTGNRYDIHGEMISGVHRVSELGFKSPFNADSRNTKERYMNEALPVIDAIERGVQDFRFYHPLPGEPRRDKVGMGVAEPLTEAHLELSTSARSGYLREWDRELAGLERISRSAELPTVVRDPPHVVELVNTLSFKTRRFLNKNIDQRTNVTVLHREHKASKLRSRVSLTLSTIVLKTVMDPVPDMEVLANAFPLLLRVPGTSIRDVWTIGLELLTWRRTLGDYAGLHRTKDEDFLEWLFINYQSARVLKAGHSANRDRMSGPEFFPHLIIQKLRFGNPKSALERIDEALLESRFGDNPAVHFFRGVAYCQLIKQRRDEGMATATNEIRKLAETARACFDTARGKGGVFPEHILDFELRHLAGAAAGIAAEDSADTDDGSSTDNGDEDGDPADTNKIETVQDSKEPPLAVLHHVYTPFNLKTTRY